jgi:hypothetical protein
MASHGGQTDLGDGGHLSWPPTGKRYGYGWLTWRIASPALEELRGMIPVLCGRRDLETRMG